MKTIDKVKFSEFLQENRLDEWLKTRRIVERELSDKQSMFCICGKLATGLHENRCRKFQNKITNDTIHLLISKLINHA